MPEIIGVPSTSMRPNRSVKISNSYLRARPPVNNLVIQEIKMLLLLLSMKLCSPLQILVPCCLSGVPCQFLCVCKRGFKNNNMIILKVDEYIVYHVVGRGD